MHESRAEGTDSASATERDRYFHNLYRRFQNSTPQSYRRISFEICRLLHGPNLPEKAFHDLRVLQLWYRTVLYAWLNDSLEVINKWESHLPAPENEFALLQLALEARNNGIRKIQRRIFRDSEKIPRKLPINSYSELKEWCDFTFKLLDDEDEEVSHERSRLTLRYDKGVAYRLEEEGKDSRRENNEWVAGFTHSFMKAICKGEPKKIEPDDDWLLVVWSGLASDKTAREATVSLFIDAEKAPKQVHTIVLDDIISATWKAMRKLGPACCEEPEVSSAKQVRRYLDMVQQFCLRQIGGRAGHAATGDEKPAPTFTNVRFKKILRIIDETLVAMERHPSSYRQRTEEDIRDHLLTVLITHFPNSTGESFNKRGKTDILIRHKRANIFIGECKLWKGVKAFHKTIDQILGYLTWRDSKAAILCFVNNKELNPVLNQISVGATKHPCFVRLESKKSESWTHYEFCLKSDSTRKIQLAVLCSHFPRNETLHRSAGARSARER